MINHVVATGYNGEIGINNELPWHIPEDLSHFKQITMGKTIVVGSNTYKSIHSYLEGKAFLPGRDVIVVSSSPTKVSELKEQYGILTNVKYWTKPILDMFISTKGSNDIYIIGGQQLYNSYTPDRIILTEVQSVYPDADAHYLIDLENYVLEQSSELFQSVSGVSYKYQQYIKKE